MEDGEAVRQFFRSLFVLAPLIGREIAEQPIRSVVSSSCVIQLAPFMHSPVSCDTGVHSKQALQLNTQLSDISL